MGVDAQMLVRTYQSFTPAEVRALAVDLCEAFGPERFWIFKDWDNEDGTTGRHALHLTAKYEQDGDDITPDSGETFIEVEPATRYYGAGYERGDLPFLIAVAQWLESRIPDARIFYGGDSSGACAEVWDAEARAVAFAHFCKVGHKPYCGGWDMFAARGHVLRCGFCAVDMIATGGGPDRSFYYCPGCDDKAILTPSTGAVLQVPRGKDFFDMREQGVA